MNTKTKQTAQAPAGGEYQVMSDNLELPRGSFFTTLAGAPAQSGDLVMFRVGRRASVGRWLPRVGGFDWILQPGLLIVCAGAAPVLIIGPITPIPSVNVRQIGGIKPAPAEP